MLTPELIFAAVMLTEVASAVCWHLYIRKKMTLVQGIAVSILVLYLSLVFESTVLGRETGTAYTYKLLPFWSYREIAAGNARLLAEDFLNVLLLLPAGGLLPVCSKRMRLSWTVLAGTGISMLIELTQLITKRGLFEFDDIFHNAVGAAVGYGIYAAGRHFIKK